MDLSQAISYLRGRHNASSSDFWSDEEILALISTRTQIVAAMFGIVELTDINTTTVAATQDYEVPSDFIRVKEVLWNGERLQEISPVLWEEEKTSGTTPQGKTERYVILTDEQATTTSTRTTSVRTIYLIPTPNAAYPLTFRGDKVHPFLTSASDTWDVPEGYKPGILEGVLADMYGKNGQNATMANFHEGNWRLHLKEVFPLVRLRMKRGDTPMVLRDSDSGIQGGHGNY